MDTVDLILEKELSEIVADIVKLYDKKGMRASGNFEKSLDVKISSSSENIKGVILGAKYAEQLNSGRGKTLNYQKSSPTLKERILVWIKDKKIQSDIKPSALAFLIARSIHRKGWKRKDVDLINEVITPVRVQLLLNNLGKSYAKVIENKILTELTNLSILK